MSDEEHIKWLAELKEGDEVCIKASGTLGTSFIITKIIKITPTRKFRTKNYLFDKRGEFVSGWSYYSLIPASSEIKQEIKNKNIRYCVKTFNFDEIPQEKINRIYAILME